jgi:hypothetical protein
VVPSGDGLVVVEVLSNTSQDFATNGNLLSNQLSRTYDTTAPTVTLTSSNPNPTNTNPIAVTATFSEGVT